jgi:outer membrane protein
MRSAVIKFLTILAFIAALSPLALYGAEGAGAADPSLRVACVDFNRALNEVSDGKRAKQRLKDEFQEKQQQLDRLQSELKSVKDSIDKDRLLLSAEALNEKEQKYRQKYSELETKLESFKREMAAKEVELTKDILTRLRTIVRDMGKEGGYTLILEKSQEVVLYSPEGTDLTDRVIQAYDQQGKGSKR